MSLSKSRPVTENTPAESPSIRTLMLPAAVKSPPPSPDWSEPGVTSLI
jgi:hypothetical protein